MKHFTIQLIDSGRQTREWSLWANTLTVGSDPRSALVLPAPMPAHVGSFRADAVVALPYGQLVVHEDTPVRQRLWEVARERIAKSRLLGWNEPGEKGRNTRAAVLAGLGALFVFASVGMIINGGSHPMTVEDSSLPTTIIDLVPEDKPKPVEKEPEPVPVEPSAAADRPNPDPNLGGSSESRTVANPPNTPAGVMAGSVLGRALDMSNENLIGNDVDPNASNMIDVILAGAGMVRGLNRTGRAGDGDDRMAAVGGIGLGTGGRSGFGTGRGTIAGTMRIGANGPGRDGVALRPTISAPKPTDVELGGEAGTRSPESILRVIRSHIGGFRYSYEKALKQNPDIGGKIALKFTIAPDGTIVSIDVVSSTTGEASLDDEIKDKARRMKFDSIEKGNVTVTYAFVLDRQ